MIGFYTDTSDTMPADTDRLVVEIGKDQVACLVKNTATGEADAFELFRLDGEINDWSDVFYEIKQASRLFGRAYADTQLFYNFAEALIIPAPQLGSEAAEDYLSLLFGENNRSDTRYDKITADDSMINAYRIRRSINELAGRHFVLHQAHHSWSRLLDKVLIHHRQEEQYIKVQFYSNHFIAILVKDKQLQLIRSYPFQTADDVLYHLLNMVQQHQMQPSHTHLEISGLFDLHTSLHEQLQQLFGRITFDETEAQGVFKTTANQYPPHYFTPFYQLAV
ncbi:MAG: hypothetical protein NVSMB63_10810 [Sediminibacterium sp.]